MFVSKRTLLCALLPLVVRVSGNNSALRGDRRILVEADKQPARSGGVGAPVQKAPAPASQAAAPLAGIPPPAPQVNPPAPSTNLPLPSQSTTPSATGDMRAPDGTLPCAAGQQQQQTRQPTNTPGRPPSLATGAPATPTPTGPQQQKPVPSSPTTTVAQQQAQQPPPTSTTPTSPLPKAQRTPPRASQNEPTVIKNAHPNRVLPAILGGGGGWPISMVAPAASPAVIEGRCEVMTPRVSLLAEPSCNLALPNFVTATTDAYWVMATEPQRQAVMDGFCQTGCGETYTGTLLARRRGCDTPTPRGRGTAVPGGPQFFPPTFPGLRLGCVIDPEDGQYCAIKMASPADGDCEFYKSCCYGELAMTTDGNAPEVSFYDMIDRRCPGSAAYRGKPCLYHQNAVVTPKLAAPAGAAPAGAASAGAAPGAQTQGMAQQGMVAPPLNYTPASQLPAGPAAPVATQGGMAPPLTYTPAAQGALAAPAQPFSMTAAPPLQAAPPLPLTQQAAAVPPMQPAAPMLPPASPLPLNSQALAVQAMAGPASLQPAALPLSPAAITVPVMAAPMQTETATEREAAVPAVRNGD